MGTWLEPDDSEYAWRSACGTVHATVAGYRDLPGETLITMFRSDDPGRGNAAKALSELHKDVLERTPGVVLVAAMVNPDGPERAFWRRMIERGLVAKALDDDLELLDE